MSPDWAEIHGWSLAPANPALGVSSNAADDPEKMRPVNLRSASSEMEPDPFGFLDGRYRRSK